MSAVGDARKRLAEAPRDILAARIAHRLTCRRCAQGWTCLGIDECDIELGAQIADLLVEARTEALRGGAATCICSEDVINAVGCICHAGERAAMLRSYDPWRNTAREAMRDA